MRIPVPRFLGRQFILPTNLGGYLNGLIFLLILLSFGYNNNLLLIFTLMLFGMNLIWVIQSHLYFKRMKFQDCTVGDAFLGQGNEVRIRWENPHAKGDWEIELLVEGKTYKLESYVSNERFLRGEVSLPSRGRYLVTRIKISSPSPFGLYRNWIFFPLSVEAFVYPSLKKKFLRSSENSAYLDGETEKDLDSYQEFLELRSSDGSLSSRISWKHYAQTGELLVKHGEGAHSPLRTLRLPDSLSGEIKERALSELATETLWCSQEGIVFEMRSKGLRLGPGSGAAFAKSALRELAIC